MATFNIEPDTHTQSLLIQLRSHGNEAKQAVDIVDRTADEDVTSHMFAAAISACDDQWRTALLLLQRASKLRKADEAVFTATAQCCARAGEYQKAFKVIDTMLARGLLMNKYSFSFVIGACLEYIAQGPSSILPSLAVLEYSQYEQRSTQQNSDSDESYSSLRATSTSTSSSKIASSSYDVSESLPHMPPSLTQIAAEDTTASSPTRTTAPTGSGGGKVVAVVRSKLRVSQNDREALLQHYLQLAFEKYPYLLTNAVCQRIMKELTTSNQPSLAAAIHLGPLAHTTCKAETLSALLTKMQELSATWSSSPSVSQLVSQSPSPIQRRAKSRIDALEEKSYDINDDDFYNEENNLASTAAGLAKGNGGSNRLSPSSSESSSVVQRLREKAATRGLALIALYCADSSLPTDPQGRSLGSRAAITSASTPSTASTAATATAVLAAAAIRTDERKVADDHEIPLSGDRDSNSNSGDEAVSTAVPYLEEVAPNLEQLLSRFKYQPKRHLLRTGHFNSVLRLLSLAGMFGHSEELFRLMSGRSVSRHNMRASVGLMTTSSITSSTTSFSTSSYGSSPMSGSSSNSQPSLLMSRPEACISIIDDDTDSNQNENNNNGNKSATTDSNSPNSKSTEPLVSPSTSTSTSTPSSSSSYKERRGDLWTWKPGIFTIAELIRAAREARRPHMALDVARWAVKEGTRLPMGVISDAISYVYR
jgi:pentatricopeptide repeat protein